MIEGCLAWESIEEKGILVMYICGVIGSERSVCGALHMGVAHGGSCDLRLAVGFDS